MPFPLGISASQLKTPPLPPAVVSQSDSGSGRDFDNGASFLTFQDTPYTGKLPIVDYTITAVSTDGLDTVEQVVTALAPTVLTGLKSGKSYKFKVKARNLVFSSSFSSEFGPGTATTVPGRTTSAGATNLANGGGATLSWIAPANAGKPITSYLITPNIGTPIETGNASTSYSFSGLTLGGTYNFTVSARNENGLGQASTTSNLITITQYVAPTPVPTPVAPTPTPTTPTPTPTTPTPTPPSIVCPPTIFTPLFSGSTTCVNCYYIGNGVDCSISAYTCDGGSTGPCTTPTPTPTTPTPTPTVNCQTCISTYQGSCPAGYTGSVTICNTAAGCDNYEIPGTNTCTPPAPTPTPTAPTPTPTATRTALYTYNEYRSICCGSATITVYSDGSETSRCNSSCTPTPTPTAPTPTPTAPTPTPTAPTPTPTASPTCACRDFRGRCLSLSQCVF